MERHGFGQTHEVTNQALRLVKFAVTLNGPVQQRDAQP
ncbi:hypothetical protein SAMN06265784_103619 [Paraburkholderia susongensis]|uniref:Uncharacterized protein n=1 Tax=Paraburkholderia susongensis TaxID=1515439 RepID=A0A1X7KDG3_9BURK|nr:hypothetical protein SAMN06265784_103619 [Paraburkholderia susongensis]